MKLLILCTGNSCRSQMAEGFFRHYAEVLNKKDLEVVSAGVETHGLNPRAVKVMSEVNVDITGHTSDHIDIYLDTGITHVLTVCDHAAEICPVFPEQTKVIHHSFPDPAKATGTEEAILNSFKKVRDEIKDYAQEFLKIHT